MVEGAFFLEAVCFADRLVEIDRKGCGAGSRAGRPGPPQESPADPVELANVAPAEAPQERAEGGGRLDREAQDPAGAAGAQRVRVVDRVAAREGRHDEGQQLVAAVRRAGPSPEVEVAVDEFPQAG